MHTARFLGAALIVAGAGHIASAQVAIRPSAPSGVLRVEATGSVSWRKAPFDASGGSKSYWFHLSVAKARGRTTGGFTLELPNRMTGLATDMIPFDPPTTAGRTATVDRAAQPLRAKVLGSCEYDGHRYAVEIDLVSNRWNPPTRPGARGSTTPGSFQVKLTEMSNSGQPTNRQNRPSRYESCALERPYVRFYDHRPIPAARSIR